MKKLLLITLSLCVLALPARADAFSALESCCNAAGYGRIRGVEVLELVVVSDCEDVNTALNPPETWASPDLGETMRTVYVQTPNGGRGLRLRFADPLFNRLRRWDRVRVDLNGCSVSRSSEYGALTVDEVNPYNIIWYSHGGPEGVTVKSRSIAEISGKDAYTLVRVENVDFAFKDGAFLNVNELFTQYVPALHPGLGSQVMSRMDGGECYLRDTKGDGIHMGINGLCNWRRDKVPSGSGSVTGVITIENNRRWGYGKEKLVIRPASRKDIEVSTKRKDCLWQSLCAWHPEQLDGANLDFEKAGNTERAMFDRCISTDGAKAYLWTDAKCAIKRAAGLNSSLAGKEGGVSKGAIEFVATNEDWWIVEQDGSSKAHSIFIEFSASKVRSGAPIVLAFNWFGGNWDLHNSRYFPARWRLYCSLDGSAYIPCPTADGDVTAALRPMPGKDFVSKAGNAHYQPLDSSIGLQEQIFKLPSEAAGKASVLLRLTPATPAVFYFDTRYAADAEKHARFNNPATMPDRKNLSTFRFENIQVDYLK